MDSFRGLEESRPRQIRAVEWGPTQLSQSEAFGFNVVADQYICGPTNSQTAYVDART